ncbi:hypothetical protein OS035_24285 [Rhizobium sp. 268]|uniref:hypothetical protein n=1 Tax=Rhizobium sp. 268 TaxID=2996375 RepID=UPI002F9454F3
MAFIELSEAASRLGVSISYLRDLIDRMDRIPRVRFLDPKKDFWSDDDGLVDEQDLRTYEQVLRQRRFIRFRERYADVLHENVELSCRPGWKSLLERVADRLRWMPPDWNARLREAREKSGYLVVGIDYDRARQDAFNEIERLREEIRLSSLSVCEECGRNGRFRYSPSRSLTLCDKHARLAEPTLPDDGLMADPASNGASISELPFD